MEIKKLLIPFYCFALVSCSNTMHINDLTCEYRSNPLAVETEKPHLSWKILSEERGVNQQAYRILVADSREQLDKNQGNVWDSGKIPSDQSINIPYAGKELKTDACYYWKVKVWNQAGEESDWSESAMWRQVEKNPQMKWIGYKDPMDKPDRVSSIWYRKNYTLNNLPDSPVYADVATPGYYELYVNGQKVGKDVLSPSVSGKDKRTFYVTYDIQSYLKEGVNTIALWVARGWAGTDAVPVAFRSEVPQQEGILVMETDLSWKAQASNYATIGTWSWGNFGGECQDARKMIFNWNATDLDDSSWENVLAMEVPSPSLVAQPCELNREMEYEPASSITELDNHCYEISFAKARTGYYRVFFPKMNEGDSIVLHFADARWTSKDQEDTPAGKIATMGLVYTKGDKLYRYPDYNQRSIYVSSGKDNEYIEAKFNPLGFQYIVVEGLNEPPVRAEAALVETDLKRIGNFECSNNLFMKMHQVNDWTMRCLNQGGFYVDCPQRERLGYGDGQVSIESSIMNYYMPSFYRKFVYDWALRQDKNTGYLPHVAPNQSGGGGPAWAGLVAAAAWRNYVYYDDKSLLEEMYPVMYAYLNYLETKSVNQVYKSEPGPWDSIGDWLAPGRGMDTNNWPDKIMAEVFNNSYIVYLWDIQRKAALALGKQQDAEVCARKISQLRPLVHEAYYDKEKGYYVSDEQPYLMMPLMAGIVPEELRASIWKKLEDNINKRGSFQTGMIGTYMMINFLLENGRNDLLYKMINHTNYPGWGYMLSQGATTWWEQWNGYYSHIHSVFTSLDSWFYQGLAGIQALEQEPGMKYFRIKPAFDVPLEHVKASTQSLYGTISSEWEKQKDGTLQLKVEIPSNSSAEVWFPCSDKENVSEGSILLENIIGVTNVINRDTYTMALLSSGKYCFNIKYPLINLCKIKNKL